jgi:radical SAM-linked protein
VTFAREQPPDGEVPTGRDYIGRWEGTIVDGGLPAILAQSGRPRIALAAPLPSGCSAQAELLEFWLAEVLPAWAVRTTIDDAIPAGHRLVALENIWLGAPPLSGQVAAADYEVAVRVDGPGADLETAVGRVLAAGRLPRERIKGGETRTYDLRPLVISLQAIGSRLLMRTRIHPELGTGRPDEVVAALGEAAAADLTVERIVRTRLLLGDDLAR